MNHHLRLPGIARVYILEKDLNILSLEFSATVRKLKMRPQIKSSPLLIMRPNFI